jgi:hypothetical protein
LRCATNDWIGGKDPAKMIRLPSGKRGPHLFPRDASHPAAPPAPELPPNVFKHSVAMLPTANTRAELHSDQLTLYSTKLLHSSPPLTQNHPANGTGLLGASSSGHIDVIVRKISDPEAYIEFLCPSLCRVRTVRDARLPQRDRFRMIPDDVERQSFGRGARSKTHKNPKNLIGVIVAVA